MAGSILRVLAAMAAAFGLSVPSARAQDVCATDLNGDGVIDSADLGTVLSSWGPCSGCPGDTNSDGAVDMIDLAVVLTRWGGTCAPTVTGITPNAGPLAGGVTVRIAGNNLLNPSSVTFGGTAATIVSSTQSAVSVIAPARPVGTAAVVVTTQGGSATAGSFAYYGVPTITHVTPNAGYAGGGNTVTITGTNFYGTPTVRFAKASATSVAVLSPTQIRAVTPAGEVGTTVAVSVATTAGTSTLVGAFSYVSIIVPSWATLIEASPDPSVVTSAELRAAIVATNLAWRVRDNATQIEMLLVPSGAFSMGCSPSTAWSCVFFEEPVRTVTLTQAFYIGRYEVTQAQWTARMGSNPAFFNGESAEVPAMQVPNRPVEQVSWQIVQSFLSSTGLRLPSEAEWEYAYRAGTTSAFHSMPGVPDGTSADSEIGEIAWWSQNALNQTHPVGLKAANALGIHDMSGNVAELVNDLFSSTYYAWGHNIDPQGPPPGPGAGRVLRGGDYQDNGFYLRSSARLTSFEDTVFRGYGFRVVRNP
jgi:formylglycine-generating enzyme required for sulfatase activity